MSEQLNRKIQDFQELHTAISFAEMLVRTQDKRSKYKDPEDNPYREWIYEQTEADPHLALRMASLLFDSGDWEVRTDCVNYLEQVPHPMRTQVWSHVLEHLKLDEHPEVQRYLYEGELAPELDPDYRG
jgi:hypothetical protein